MDTEYYRGRAETERELADAARSESARTAHLDLASRYEALLAEPPPED